MAWRRRFIALIAGITFFILLIKQLPDKPRDIGPRRIPPEKAIPVTKPPLPSVTPIRDNFPLALSASNPSDLPDVSAWNKPKQVNNDVALFIGFTRNWPMLQQAVVSYITAGWPPDKIYVVDNTGTFRANKYGSLSLQNPFYFAHLRLTKVFGVNVIATPTLLSFSQLQNFYLDKAIERGWKQYFWSHMDVLVLSDERPQSRPFKSLYQCAIQVLRETTRSEDSRWAARMFSYDQLTLVNVEAYLDVGAWDTFIPYYGSDCDMYERLQMAGWKIEEAKCGLIYDMGQTLPDLRVLYREDNEDNRKICEEVSNGSSEYGLGDCQFEAIAQRAQKIQDHKLGQYKGRNFWQGSQMGGQGEPFYRDPLGFEQSFEMTSKYGQDIMSEKWGHTGCDLRQYNLKTGHQWRVSHGAGYRKPQSLPYHGCPR